MAISKNEIEILKFAEKRILQEINEKFITELHINGRLYDNKPKCSIFTETVDDELLMYIRSYISSVINEIIYVNKHDI